MLTASKLSQLSPWPVGQVSPATNAPSTSTRPSFDVEPNVFVGARASTLAAWRGKAKLLGAAGDCTVNLTVTVSGNPPCESSCELPITINENPSADPNDAAICEGFSAEICANASGGSGNYTYAWTGPGGFTAITECIAVTVAGVTVFDGAYDRSVVAWAGPDEPHIHHIGTSQLDALAAMVLKTSGVVMGVLALTGTAAGLLAARRLGEPVLRYLTGLRMQLARRELLETSDTLARIAERVGYRSEPAFNRAFKRVVGVAPGAVRKPRA